MFKKSFPLLWALCLVMAGSWPAHAEDAVVLKNSQVTESALIDALGVEAPQGALGATRGFKPSVQGGATAAPRKPAGPGRANLLITFETNSAALTGDSQTALDTVGKALQSDALAGLTFRVEGHADARGDAEANRKLSQQRAEAVVGYLVSKHGVLPERLVPQGKGSSEPLNKDRIDAPENRRVTIVTIRG
jgi:outer membrane protein OmpA-like peptidoglycan-associated protein